MSYYSITPLQFSRKNMKQFEIQLLHMVTMSLLDGEIERSLVAFLDQDTKDVNAQAQSLAEEHGAVLLHLEALETAALYMIEDRDKINGRN